jgi:cellulose synthase/poly-beta-1,6-N-acetylglucosamine synthase-like glycosyltransferase
MLEWIAVFIAICSGLAAMLQGIFARAFTRHLLTSPVDALPPDQCPEAAILLPLRGADVRLEDTLRRLIRQDHPNFTVRVIVDNINDPAMEVALRVANEPGGERLRIATIQQRRTTCGLQCSALYEAAVQLEDSVVDVATIDGDVVVHSSWLRELVAPLHDPAVGASFGNRWFTPHHGQWGSVVRYLWNAAAIVPMWIFSIPWGGTFAIKRKWLIETGLMDRWKRVMVHDALVPYLLDREGLEVKFVPSLMMPIGEACDLGFCFQFLKRQMLWTRMYHPNFTVVMLHAVITSTLAIAVMIAACWSIFVGRWFVAWWLIAACIAYLGTMMLLLRMIDRAAMTVIQRRGDEPIHYPSLGWLRLLVAIPLTQIVYCSAIMAARTARTVRWRGITYKIQTAYDVKLVEDNLNSANAAGRQVSL